MLKQDEQTRIRDEELFRQEVRRELEASKPKKSAGAQFWSLLNSSFALWFLSSVILTGLTSYWSWHRQQNDEKMKKLSIQKRLNTEVSFRIEEGLMALRLDKERSIVYKPSSIYTEAKNYLDNKVTGYSVSIYPEYPNRSFRSLLFELHEVVETSQLPELKQATLMYKRLEDLCDRNYVKIDSSKLSDKIKELNAINQSIGILDSLQMHTFWRIRM